MSFFSRNSAKKWVSSFWCSTDHWNWRITISKFSHFIPCSFVTFGGHWNFTILTFSAKIMFHQKDDHLRLDLGFNLQFSCFQPSLLLPSYHSSQVLLRWTEREWFYCRKKRKKMKPKIFLKLLLGDKFKCPKESLIFLVPLILEILLKMLFYFALIGKKHTWKMEKQNKVKKMLCWR